MKKLAVLILVLFLSFGCAGLSSQPASDLEARTKALEDQVKKLELMAAAGEAAVTDRVWPFYELTGGGNALDGISEGNIGSNDTAIGRDSNSYGYIYYWDATHAAACSAPACVRPTDTDNIGSWLNVTRFYAVAFFSSAADGDHYVDPSNSSAFPTGMAEGSIACRDDRDACFVFDGSLWWTLFTGKYGDCNDLGCDDANPDTATITTVYAWGGVFSNNGAIGNVTLTLVAAVQGMRITIVRIDGSGNITIQENSGSSDVIDGAADIVLDADLESVTLYAIDSTTWIVVADSGAPTYN